MLLLFGVANSLLFGVFTPRNRSELAQAAALWDTNKEDATAKEEVATKEAAAAKEVAATQEVAVAKEVTKTCYVTYECDCDWCQAVNRYDQLDSILIKVEEQLVVSDGTDANLFGVLSAIRYR